MHTIHANRYLIIAIAVAACLFGFQDGRVAAQHSSSIDTRLDSLERAIAATQSELRGLNAFVRTAIPSPLEEIEPIELNLKDSPGKGSDNAPVWLVEFSDFECPFCAQHYRTAYRQLMAQLVDTGQVKYVFKNLPLEPIHPNALSAAEAAQCAGDQGRFWEMHDRLFEHQKELTKPQLRAHARLCEFSTVECCTKRHASGLLGDHSANEL